jgi:hypothetical protein
VTGGWAIIGVVTSVVQLLIIGALLVALVYVYRTLNRWRDRIANVTAAQDIAVASIDSIVQRLNRLEYGQTPRSWEDTQIIPRVQPRPPDDRGRRR